ncbi:uncharacterized protein [Anabrus simplex]|uniref:uncharacterized protein n=1 Tax=Anabrus simplex TaxID=316456 RepID=UPI0035A38578
MPEFSPAGVLLHGSKSTATRLTYLNTFKYHRTEPESNLPRGGQQVCCFASMESTSRACCLRWMVLILFITPCPVGLGEECVPGERIVNNPTYSTAGCKYGNVARTLSSETIDRFLNKSAGTLTVSFPLNKDNDLYSVVLYSEMKAKTPDECKEFKGKKIKSSKIHSEQKFSTASCKEKLGESASRVNGSVVFNFVYPSCYVVSVGNINTEPWLLDKNMTKYRYIPPQERIPGVGSADTSSELYNGRRNITVTFKNFNLLVRDKIPVHMFLVQNDTCETDTEENVIAKYSVHKTDEGNLKCTKQKDLPFVKNCMADDNSSNCTFINLTPGSYCLRVDPDEPVRCKKLSRDLNSCSFQHSFDVKGETIVDKPPEITVDNAGSNLLVYLAVVLSLISFIVISAIIRTLYQNLPTLEPHQVKILHSKPKVLLLYAQDCEIFMELMTVFREVLSSIGQCKI